MTREEAIKLLKHISTAYTPIDAYGDYDDPQPYEDALSMAIETLSEPSKVDFRTDELVNIGTEVNDLISRADAIEAVARYMMDDALIDSNYASEDINDWIEIGQSILEDVPTADAVSREDFTKAIKAGLKLQAELNADRPTGKWISEVDTGIWFLKCSECGCRVQEEQYRIAVGTAATKCPYCGAELGLGGYAYDDYVNRPSQRGEE